MAQLSEVLDLLEEKEDLDWDFVEYLKVRNDKDIQTMITERDTLDFLGIRICPGWWRWKVTVTNLKGMEKFKVSRFDRDKINRLRSIYNKARSTISEDIDINEYA